MKNPSGEGTKRGAVYAAVPEFRLPASLLNTGNLSLVSKLSEADSADTELAEICVGSAAKLASVVGTAGKLGSSLLLSYH